MKRSPQISVRLSEDLMKKLIYISQAEGRTPNNQFVMMLRNTIAYFERTKGRISNAELSKIDISQYITDDSDQSK